MRRTEDEFGVLPPEESSAPEFQPLPEEIPLGKEEEPIKTSESKENQRHDAKFQLKLAAMMTAAVVSVTTVSGGLPTLFKTVDRVAAADLTLPANTTAIETTINETAESVVIIETVTTADSSKESVSSETHPVSTIEVTETTEPIETTVEEPSHVLVKVECTECNGTGIICPGAPDFGYDRGNGEGYAGCGGTGYSVCPDKWCHDGIKTCEGCKGVGTLEDGRICGMCNGTKIVDCEFCNNTGIAVCISLADHLYCDTCFGTGFIEITE